jgi:hypothetical protein
VENQCIARDCFFCHEFGISYSYEGSCTISFPERILENKLAYTVVELEGGEAYYALDGGACDGESGFAFAGDYQSITLCNEPCDAFELGSVTVFFAIPPCE